MPGSDMSLDQDGVTGLATPSFIDAGLHVTSNQLNNRHQDQRSVTLHQMNVHIAHDRTGDLENLAESRHVQS